MTLSGRSIGIGVLAGLAAALLSIGVIIESSMAIVLYFLAPLPIFIAALGWGTGAGAVAAVAAAVAVGVFASPLSGLAMALVTALPAIACAYMAGLARPAEELGGEAGKFVWFPLSAMLWRLTLIAAAVTIVLGVIIGFNEALIRDLSREMVSLLGESDPSLAQNSEIAPQLAQFLLAMLPVSSAALMVVTLTANLYIALRLTALSQRLARPRDDWPSGLRMPPVAVVVFIAAVAASFAPGSLGHIAAAISGALGAGFMLAGFAAFHYRTRGRTWRPVALWFAYVATALFGFVAFFFVVAGLFEASFMRRARTDADES